MTCFQEIRRDVACRREHKNQCIGQKDDHSAAIAARGTWKCTSNDGSGGEPIATTQKVETDMQLRIAIARAKAGYTAPVAVQSIARGVIDGRISLASDTFPQWLKQKKEQWHSKRKKRRSCPVQNIEVMPTLPGGRQDVPIPILLTKNALHEITMFASKSIGMAILH